MISNECFEFEKRIADMIVELVSANFKARPETLMINVDQEIDKRAIREIAAEYDVQQYLGDLRKEMPASETGGATGAIVMNCNPFTKGHRYLIELAASRVDTLIVFVVEQDLSFFRFRDRFKMVCDGVADLRNVRVLRSGKFIISTVTFPSYFSKDDPDLANFDASLDVDFFGEYVAPALNIGIRFFGSEPHCRVTGAYNRQMRESLPKFRIKVEEIARKEIGGRPISASQVREALKSNDWPKIKELVPDSTLHYLQDMVYNDESPPHQS
jgi:[citrate (pro-3S)-lyase] ligase